MVDFGHQDDHKPKKIEQMIFKCHLEQDRVIFLHFREFRLGFLPIQLQLYLWEGVLTLIRVWVN